MCYADTATDDGTATALCYVGWSMDHVTLEAADADAERHRAEPDAAELAEPMFA